MGRSTTQVKIYVDNIIEVDNGGTSADNAPQALLNLGAASALSLAEEKARAMNAELQLKTEIDSVNSTATRTYAGGQFNTVVDKGSVAFGTVTFKMTEGNVQRLYVAGPVSLRISNFPPSGVFGDLLVELVNGGSYTVEMPNVSWIKPSNGEPANSFTEYLLDIGRENGVLKTNGSDFLYFKTTSSGVIVYGKLI